MRPKIPILSFGLDTASDQLSAADTNNLKFFRVEEPLSRLGLVLKFPESNVHEISVSSLMSEPSDTFHFRCPRLPHDLTARIGVRRNPANPDKIEKIFRSARLPGSHGHSCSHLVSGSFQREGWGKTWGKMLRGIADS